jgi:hypothetical protein
MRFPIKITDNFLLEPVMKMFGAGPAVSFCDVDGGKLHVKMGVWFDESFPLAQIAQVAPSDWPWWGGLGVKLVHHGVGVVGSTEGIVNVKFKSPQKARVIVTVDATQLFLSLEDPEGFMKNLGEACGIGVSPHTPF